MCAMVIAWKRRKPNGRNDMIYSNKEAEYNAAYNEYMAARSGFYAGKVSAENFISLRNAMEAAADEWEADRLAA